MSSRYKPQGWFGEPHRHYLAAKGIKSKQPIVPGLFSKMFSIAASGDVNKAVKQGSNQQLFSRKYFVRNELKGNRSSSALHRAYAKGWTKDELRSDSSARNKFGISLDELERNFTDSFPQSTSESQKVDNQDFRSLPVQDIPTIEENFSEVPTFEESLTQPSVEEALFEADEVPVSQSIATPGVPMRSRLSEDL